MKLEEFGHASWTKTHAGCVCAASQRAKSKDKHGELDTMQLDCALIPVDRSKRVVGHHTSHHYAANKENKDTMVPTVMPGICWRSKLTSTRTALSYGCSSPRKLACRSVLCQCGDLLDCRRDLGGRRTYGALDP